MEIIASLLMSFLISVAAGVASSFIYSGICNGQCPLPFRNNITRVLKFLARNSRLFLYQHLRFAERSEEIKDGNDSTKNPRWQPRVFLFV